MGKITLTKSILSILVDLPAFSHLWMDDYIMSEFYGEFAMRENFLAQEMVKFATRIVSGRGGAISNEVAAGNMAI